MKTGSLQPFEFATAARIVFGPGTLPAAIPAICELGSRVVFVCGRNLGRVQPLVDELRATGLAVTVFSVTGEPTVDSVREGAALARESLCDSVVAMGGGSVLDAGKAIGALLANPGDPLDYLEVIGRGQPLLSPSAPVTAIPTTAGTGSEATRNAVLGSTEHGVKASMRSAGMLPRLAIVDPELTLALPREITVSTGFDALTQLIEPFVSRRANPLVDALCQQGISLVAKWLPLAAANGRNVEARTGMALASLYGGIALANAGLGSVHGFAAPIGGEFPAPHGAVCAAMLPHAMRINLRALRERMPEADAIRRYRQVASLLTGDSDATADDAVAWVQALSRELGVPPLSRWGLRVAHGPGLAQKAARANSMKANPVELTQCELCELFEAAV